METLEELKARINSFNRNSLPSEGVLQTSAGLSAKVDENGKMKKFIGNTVVYSLPGDFTEKAAVLCRRLHETCGDFLAEPISESTFHITLHDLANGIPSEETDSAVEQTEQAALERVARIKNENFRIRLKTTYLFNMVNTSMVLGFEPADEESHNKLMEYYELFQEVVMLGYPLTPHMTAAYFRPGIADREQLERLQEIIDLASAQKPVTVELSGDMLSYMVFDDMNTYTEKLP